MRLSEDVVAKATGRLADARALLSRRGAAIQGKLRGATDVRHEAPMRGPRGVTRGARDRACDRAGHRGGSRIDAAVERRLVVVLLLLLWLGRFRLTL
jgi:hypothetical protein